MNNEVQNTSPAYEELLRVNQELLKQNTEQQAMIEEVIIQNASLQQQLDWFKKQLFGEKSEKRPIKSESDAKQLSLGEVLQEKTKVEESTVTIKEYSRVKRKKQSLNGSPEDTGLRFDESQIPVETIFLENPEANKLSEEEYKVISEKTRYRLAQKPGAYYIIKYVMPVIKVKESEEVVNTPVPESVLEKSYADVSLLAGILIDKFQYHLPLYRQHQRLQASGIMISRTTLTNYVHRVADLLKPIAHAQQRSILKSHVLSMDETPFKAGKKEKGKMQKGYFWPMYGDRDEVSFIFKNTRSGEWLKNELKQAEFTGVLLSDGFSAYDKVHNKLQCFTQAQCWAHARRYFIEAERIEPELSKKAVTQIAEFYKEEEQIKESGLTGEKKLKHRATHIKQLVEDYFLWLKEVQKDKSLLPSNKFSKAVSYSLKREEELKSFLSDPEVPIDNNHTERAIRPLVMGRKNYLFCWTEVGAETVAIIQSLITTCKLQGIRPYEYLVDVLQRIDSHPVSQVHELTPRLWKDNFQDSRIKTPLEQYQDN